MALKRAHLLISGRVQGVFFRAYTEEGARELGLGGWVRNLPDGRVEAMIEGEQEAVTKAIAICHKGPPGARVDDIEIQWETPTGEFTTFGVRYG